MDQKKIWDFFQTDDKVAFLFERNLPRYQFLAGFIAPDEKVLNIGVGRGDLERILLKLGAKVSALDPSVEAIRRLKTSLNLGDCARVGCSDNVPFESETFDCVIMTEVLEHLPSKELELTLAEVKRVLKRNGRFLGTVPADENLELNEVVCPFCGKVFHRWGHVQSFSREGLNKLLAGKFSRVSISRHYFPYWRELNWKGRISAVLKLGLLKLGIAGSDTTFFFKTYK